MMAVDVDIYGRLADLLVYPTTDFPDRVRSAIELLRRSNPTAADFVTEFAHLIEGQPPQRLEELFTRTFDINPICCLEVGWQLHGDNYDRGAFLVRMRQLLRGFGLEESSELPDHLTHMLALLGRMQPRDADELATKSLLPAVTKMLEGMKGDQSPYEHVLLAIQSMLCDRLQPPRRNG